MPLKADDSYQSLQVLVGVSFGGSHKGTPTRGKLGEFFYE